LIRYVDTELGETRYCRSSNDGVLEDDSVVDVPNVLRRLKSFGSFDSEKVENADRELRKLAVFDELAELGES
jgi:hypothetical protein